MDRSNKSTSNIQEDEDEDPFKIGTVLFTAGGDNAADVWDDSDLIDHWDRNIEAYRNRYSSQAKDEVDNDDPPFQQTKRFKAQAGHISKKKPVLRKKLKNMHHSYQSQTDTNNHESESTSKEKDSSEEIPSHSANKQPPHMPPMPPMPSNQEDLSNLIMAWYYCGYYTGLYQAQK